MDRTEFELPVLHKGICRSMIKCGKILAKNRLNNIVSGNESVVVKDVASIDELSMYITRSGSKLGHLEEPRAIIKTSLGYDGNMILASSEADIHKRIHRRRFETNPYLKISACAHAHAIYTTTLSIELGGTGTKEMEIPKKYRTERLKGVIPVFVSEYGSGAKDMVDAMPEILTKHPGLVLGCHGVFAAGSNLGECLDYIMELEATSKKIVSDRIIPEKNLEIEGRIPKDWLVRYGVAEVSGSSRYGRDTGLKTIGELIRELGKSLDDRKTARIKYLDEIFNEFRVAGQDLTDFSMDPFKRGSLSRRIGGTVYITRNGADFSNLKEDDILVFKIGGGDGIKVGLCEAWLHEMIYCKVACNYIAHLTPEYSSRYSLYCGNAIIPIDVEGQYIVKRIPVVDLGDAVLSKDNAHAVIGALKSNEKVAYVKGLGGIAIGLCGFCEPLHFLESAESSAKMITLAEKIGIDIGAKQMKFREW